ncbi:hypothetical protein KQI30_13670 [Clostridium bornimense]|uniref:RNA polymerase sigma factor n=1 Tax=Clostridium bornimense TaxID=1216932 RepID=UPI001C103E65|nr:hypothetical protein [Clostridium bornimense]
MGGEKLQTIGEIYKEVLYLRLTGDLSFKEIGEILERSENWARVTYYRGKSKVIRRLNDEK